MTTSTTSRLTSIPTDTPGLVWRHANGVPHQFARHDLDNPLACAVFSTCGALIVADHIDHQDRSADLADPERCASCSAATQPGVTPVASPRALGAVA